MTTAIQRYKNQDEDGFTLIELLVVVIIIGILAAIAIPAFLNQRERAWQAEVTSAVRNAALEIEAEATQSGGSYPIGDAAGLALAVGFVNTQTGSGIAPATGTGGDPIAVVTYVSTDNTGGLDNTADNGFALCGSHADITGDNSIMYLGGSAGNGLTDFEEATCAANSNAPA